MGEFFQGWRRKVGVLMLLMACIFICGWIRSLTTNDAISFHGGRHTTEILQSVNCVIVWQRSQFDNDEHVMAIPVWTTHKFYPHTKWFDETGMVWRWESCGFGFGELPSGVIEGVREKYFFVPYWSITIPLTFISFWLWLSKPRQSNQKKTSEPAANEGT